MRVVKLRSGGSVFVLAKNETCPTNSICFQEDEFDWVKTRSKDYSADPEALREFWKTLLKKKQNPSYSFFDDFPRTTGLAICKEILEMLSAKKKIVD